MHIPDKWSLSHLRVLHDLFKESALCRGQHRAEGVRCGVVACTIDRGRDELLEWEAGPPDTAGRQQFEERLSDRRKHLWKKKNTERGASAGSEDRVAKMRIEVGHAFLLFVLLLFFHVRVVTLRPITSSLALSHKCVCH